MNLQELIQGPLGQQLINGLSNQLGASDNKVASAVSMAIPFLLSQMNKNAQSSNGAASLNTALNDHRGISVDNVMQILNSPNMADGLGILGHVFGNKQTQVAQNIGKQSGISTGQVMQILATLAPIIMGFLGNQKQQQGVDSSGLSGMLGSILGGIGQQNQSEMGFIERILDQDGDGSYADEMMDIGGKLLGGFFKR